MRFRVREGAYFIDMKYKARYRYGHICICVQFYKPQIAPSMEEDPNSDNYESGKASKKTLMVKGRRFPNSWVRV